MPQSSHLQCLVLDASPSSENRLTPTEVRISGGEVVEALVITMTVVVIDEPIDARFEVTGQIVCLLYTSPSPRDGLLSRMPSSA